LSLPQIRSAAARMWLRRAAVWLAWGPRVFRARFQLESGISSARSFPVGSGDVAATRSNRLDASDFANPRSAANARPGGLRRSLSLAADGGRWPFGALAARRSSVGPSVVCLVPG